MSVIIISIFKTIWNVFVFPENLWQVTTLTKKKAILIFVLFGMIIGTPYLKASIQTLEAIGTDMQVIAGRIPELTIENEKLTIANGLEQTLLVKTNTANLVIYAENVPDSLTIEREIEKTPLSFLMTDSYLRVATPATHFDLSYDLLDGLTADSLKVMLNDFGTLNIITVIPMVIVSLLVGLVDGLFQLIIMALVVNILSLLFQIRLPFAQNFKLVLVASFIPTLVMALLNTLGIYPAAQTALLASITAYIYYKGIIRHITRL